MNLDNVCRTCLRIPKHPTNLFEDKLIHKIESTFSIQIENITELPSKICEECLKNINHFYNFRKVIINTEKDLKMRLDTLKKTNYICKPRSKTKQVKKQQDSYPEHHYLDVKSDQDNDITSDQEDNHDPDIWLQKALATKKLYKCEQCKLTFPSRIKLNNHKRTYHAAPGICNICGTVLRSDNLKKHIKLHSEGPCTCEICGKSFKNSESLRTHKILHSEHTYTCEICGRTFKIKSEHTRHLKKHQDPDFQKVTCTVCGKKVHELKKHMLTHTGEKPHVCTQCLKGFCSAYSLKIHQRQHTNEKPYICGLCTSRFSQKVSLVTHLKTKHGVNF